MPPLERGSGLDHICLVEANDGGRTRPSALLHKCLLPRHEAAAPDPAKQAVDLSVRRQLSSSHHHHPSPLWGPSCPSPVTACCPPSPLLPSPPTLPNKVACQANLAQLPMIILSAVVSPAAAEEVGRSEAFCPEATTNKDL